MSEDKNSLSILQINTADVNGGAAAISWNLYQAFKQQGHSSWLAVGYKKSKESHIFALANDQWRSPWARKVGLIRKKIHIFDGKIRGLGFLDRILQWVAEPRRCCARSLGREDYDYPGIWHFWKRLPEKPDIINCHNLHGEYFNLSSLPWLSHQVPVILTLHDAWLLSGHCSHSFHCERWKSGCGDCPDLNIFPPLKRDGTAYNWQRKQKIYRQSKVYVTTPCQWLMSKVEQSILAPAIIGKKVISYGIDLNIFQPAERIKARQALGLPLDVDILLFVSHGIANNRWRDYAMLERTVKNLAQMSRSKPVILLCLGEERESRYFANAQIRFISYEYNPEIKVKYYQASDIFLFPSGADTLPIAILEALACGIPVISTLVGGIPEQIAEGKTGFLVPPGDVLLMTERISQLLGNVELRRSFAQEAIETSRQRFDLHKQAQIHLNWYNEILRSVV